MSKRNEQEQNYLRALGKKISTIRQEKKMTQKELGFLIDMEDTNINRIEKGNTNPTVLTLRKVCIALGADLSELLSNIEK